MIIGIGLDITEITRIRDLAERKPAFINRILTEVEEEKFQSLTNNRKFEYLAGRFAGKEAYAKALGCGIGKQLSFQDISIINDDMGKPHIHTKHKNEINKKRKIHLSITHTESYAAAQVIIEE